MRRHAKASSAGTTTGQVSHLGHIFRGSLATRATPDVDGWSRTSSHLRVIAFALALGLLSLCLGASVAHAGKQLDSRIGTGTAGNAPGQFNNQVGIDVNNPNYADGSLDPYGNSTDGYLYVADEDNHRIQVFDDDGEFVFTFGGEVNATETANVCPRPGFPGDDCAKTGNQVDQGRGYLDDPQGIAIDQVTGDVYVTDVDNVRVQKFTAAGEFLYMLGGGVNQTEPSATICPRPGTPTDVCKVGVSGSANGQFGATMQGHPAVDPNTQDLWVPDAGGTSNRRMQKFDKHGTFLSKFGSNGSGVGQFGSGAPSHVAVDDAGRIYVLDVSAGNDWIERFDSNGENGEVFADSELSGIPEPGRIAIDTGTMHPSTGDDRVYVMKPAGAETVVKEFDVTGSLLDTHAVEAGVTISSFAGGIGIDPASERLYLSDDSPEFVSVFDPDGVPDAIATIDPPSNVTAHSADLSGTVDPNGTTGFPASYAFQVSKNGVDWTPPLSEAEFTDVGDGSGPQPAAESFTGLEANTLYRVRILTKKEGNAPVASTELSFATDSVAPEVATLHPQSHTDRTAKLTGQVNANNLPTTYHFEYGTDTDYGSKAPVPSGSVSGGKTSFLLEEVAGLEPATTYHYRVVATNAEGTATGGDVTFVTSPATSAETDRAFEMVTPPFKGTRNTGDSGGSPFHNANPITPSVTGDSVLWEIPYFPLTEETKAGLNGDRIVIERGSDGWDANSIWTLPLLPENPTYPTPPTALMGAKVTSAAGDLGTLVVGLGSSSGHGALLPNDGTLDQHLYTQSRGTGTEGWTGWLDNVDAQVSAFGLPNETADAALFNDSGSAMIRWGFYRGLLGAAPQDDPSVTQLNGKAGGKTLYRQLDPPMGPKDLVGECTGSAGGGPDAADVPTQIPARVGSGVASDVIGVQECVDGEVASSRGADIGSDRMATAMSDDGRRVFFSSPSFDAAGVPTGSCTTATGASTSCPPQLFVKQYGDGAAVLRWISRSRANPVGDNAYSGGPIAGQQIGELGGGVAFQGASKDGQVVYFKSNAPLTPDDPNSGSSITTGTAQATSDDLYRYELPADLNADPDGGKLTRVTGGPEGIGDPDLVSAPYISHDGSRAFFITESAIDGAGADSPRGGVTSPTSPDGMFLYLYDANRAGVERWQFVARVGVGTELDECVSALEGGGPLRYQGYGPSAASYTQDAACMHGTVSGDAITFMSSGKLTADDLNGVVDVYVYDARADELIRATASSPDVAPYACVDRGSVANNGTDIECMGDFGFDPFAAAPELNRGWGGRGTYHISQDESGAVSVYFQSRSQLLPADTNGTHWDVYQWREGELSLVSTAAAGHDAYFSGNTADGSSVFFQTTDRIDPRELDDADNDIYVLREGGGFPYTPPAVPCDVLALACETEATAPQPVERAMTPTFDGPGNVSQPSRRICGNRQVRRGRRCVAEGKLVRRACRSRRGAAKQRCLRRQRRLLRVCRSKKGAAKQRCLRRQRKRLARVQRRQRRNSSAHSASRRAK